MDARDIEAKEIVPASRKLSRDDAAKMAKAASRIIVAKGRKVTRFTGGDADAVDAMLGPTGNLRAPTIRRGKTLLVGFNDDVYSEVFD